MITNVRATLEQVKSVYRIICTARSLVTLVLAPAALFAIAPQACGQIPINTDLVARSVVFIYTGSPGGPGDAPGFSATGFIVGIPLKSDATKFYPVLVTARHVIEPQWALCSRPNPDKIFLRLNKKPFDPDKDPNGTAYIPVTLRDKGHPLYLTSEDDSVDAAVVPLVTTNLSQSIYNIDPIPLFLVPSQKDLQAIGVGDEILSAGLLPAYPGFDRNYPIFKFGRVSTIPLETVPIRCPGSPTGRQMKVWLLAGNFVPGNSGSPVFFRPFGYGNAFLGSQTTPFLLGVIAGTFQDNSDSEGMKVAHDAGVAGMTPASYIYEMIERARIPDSDIYHGEKPKPPQSTVK
jgi:hypothetical protein